MTDYQKKLVEDMKIVGNHVIWVSFPCANCHDTAEHHEPETHKCLFQPTTYKASAPWL